MTASLREHEDAFGVAAPDVADCHARRCVQVSDLHGHARSTLRVSLSAHRKKLVVSHSPENAR